MVELHRYRLTTSPAWVRCRGVLHFALQSAQASRRFRSAADWHAIPVRLRTRDLAGNAMEPLEWTWTLDYSLDQEPPAAPVVGYLPSDALAENGCDRAGNWAPPAHLTFDVLRAQ